MSLRAYDENYDFRGLNIGCGNDLMPGFVNVDIGACEKDMPMDMNSPFPFPNNTFECIVAKHSLEHMNKDCFWSVFQEIHRVLRPGGVFEFEVPEAGSDNFWTDPTHTMPFTMRTMDYLIKGKALRENGEIYGADYFFIELSPPKIDGVKTIYFRLSKQEIQPEESK